MALEAKRHEVALTSLMLLTRNGSRFAAPPCGAALVGQFATAASLENGAAGIMLSGPDAAIRAIAEMGGGFVTVLSLADAWLRTAAIPTHMELAADFRISGTQACKIIRHAAEHQLVTVARNGKIVEASALVEASRRQIALEFARYAQDLRSYETSAERSAPQALSNADAHAQSAMRAASGRDASQIIRDQYLPSVGRGELTLNFGEGS